MKKVALVINSFEDIPNSKYQKFKMLYDNKFDVICIDDEINREKKLKGFHKARIAANIVCSYDVIITYGESNVIDQMYDIVPKLNKVMDNFNSNSSRPKITTLEFVLEYNKKVV